MLYELKTPWSDGTTHIKLSPLELIEKLCALIPLPNYNLFRYSGVFAPNSKLRKHIVPNPKAGEVQATSEGSDAAPPATKYSWQKLLKRSFGIDMNKCPFCSSENFKAVSMIEDLDIVQKILLAVGLEARAPPIAPAKAPQTLEYTHYFDE